MSKTPEIIQLLATFIIESNLPLEAIAVAGEVIALHARLMDYEGILARRASLAEISEGLAMYDALCSQMEATLGHFSQSSDGLALIRELTAIRDALRKLK